MKHLISILLIISILSCDAQEKEINITGNWYVETLNDSTYTEVFIDDKTINLYGIMGYGRAYNYIKENNVLYTIINGEKIKHSNIKTINQDNIFFEVVDGSIIFYKRIIGDELTFEDLLFKNPYNEKHKVKYEEEYLKAFNKRKKINTSKN